VLYSISVSHCEAPSTSIEFCKFKEQRDANGDVNEEISAFMKSVCLKMCKNSAVQHSANAEYEKCLMEIVNYVSEMALC